MSLFEKIIAHNAQKENLEQMREKKRVPHALLFSGPSGIGKKTLARAFAEKLLNSENDQAVSKLVELGNHPDFHFLKKQDEKKEILVEQVRELSSGLKLTPYQADCSVAIIDDAHELNITAANALLMTLEEPPGHSHIILISDAPHKLPETIISRCQIVSFSELSAADLKLVLKDKIGVEESGLAKLAELCEGSIQALGLDSFIDQRTFLISDKKALEKHLSNVVKKISNIENKITELIDEHKDVAAKKAVEFAGDLAAEKADYRGNLQSISRVLRKQLKLKPSEIMADLLQQAIETEENILKYNLNPQLQLNSLMLAIASANS